MDTSSPWFYHEGELRIGEPLRLSDEESQHATGSKRLREGDAVVVFDGMGTIAAAKMVGIKKRGGLEVELSAVQNVPPVQPSITIASAVPKGDRATTMLNMIAQLGASAFFPLDCQRSVATGEKLVGDRGWRIVIEACKQSRCAHLPRLLESASPMDVVKRAIDADELALAAHPSGLPVREVVDHHGLGGGKVTILIGPEGGFTDDEIVAMRDAGAHAVHLGPTILRTETASVAMLGFLRMYASK